MQPFKVNTDKKAELKCTQTVTLTFRLEFK